MDDYRQYFRALAQVTTRPVVVQTSGGAPGLAPSTDLIAELAHEFPNFGYVKEETAPIVERMKAEIRQRPAMKGIFGASFGAGWLYEMRLGLDGVITGNAMYADLMARIWDLHLRANHDDVRDAYATFLLMRNLDEQIPGANLYIMKKRGIFKTTMTRAGAPAGGLGPQGESTGALAGRDRGDRISLRRVAAIPVARGVDLLNAVSLAGLIRSSEMSRYMETPWSSLCCRRDRSGDTRPRGCR